MKHVAVISLFFLLALPCCFAQEPLEVLNASWQRDSRQTQADSEFQPRTRGMIDDNHYYKRKAREQLPVVAIDPNEASIDGRSAAIDKAMAESQAPRTERTSGYRYTANVRNDIGKTVKVVYWEYRFTELANASNVVRRQFLCSVDIKDGEKKVLSVFSTLGPTNVIDKGTLEGSTENQYNEKVLINRIELADGTILQRNDWKFQEVKKAVDRVTSGPWGTEMCHNL